jgi:hypothetical protein
MSDRGDAAVSGDYSNEGLASAVGLALRKGDRDLALRILEARPAEQARQPKPTPRERLGCEPSEGELPA